MAPKRIPSLNWLRVFDAAAQTRSFSAAARMLNMSTSAVSQQISTLEHHLGVKLFYRTPRSVTLSDEGHQLLPSVRHALASVEASVASILTHRKMKQVNVQANTMFTTSWLAPRLPDFQRQFSDVELGIFGLEHVAAASIGQSDVLVSFGPLDAGGGGSKLLFGETVYPVARSDIAQGIVSPEDLLDHPLIDVPGHLMTWPYVLGSLGLDLPENSSRVRVNISDIGFALAAAGGGIVLARAPATDGLVAAYALQRCLPATKFPSSGSYWVSLTQRGQTNPSALSFVEWMFRCT